MNIDTLIKKVAAASEIYKALSDGITKKGIYGDPSKLLSLALLMEFVDGHPTADYSRQPKEGESHEVFSMPEIDSSALAQEISAKLTPYLEGFAAKTSREEARILHAPSLPAPNDLVDRVVDGVAARVKAYIDSLAPKTMSEKDIANGVLLLLKKPLEEHMERLPSLFANPPSTGAVPYVTMAAEYSIEDGDEYDVNKSEDERMCERVKGAIKILENNDWVAYQTYFVNGESRTYGTEIELDEGDVKLAEEGINDFVMAFRKPGKNEFLRLQTNFGGQSSDVYYTLHLPHLVQGIQEPDDYRKQATEELKNLMEEITQEEYDEENISFFQSADWFDKTKKE